MAIYTILEETEFRKKIMLDRRLTPVGVVGDIRNGCHEGAPVVILKGIDCYEARCACGQAGTKYTYGSPLEALQAFEEEAETMLQDDISF